MRLDLDIQLKETQQYRNAGQMLDILGSNRGCFPPRGRRKKELGIGWNIPPAIGPASNSVGTV